MLNQGDGDGTTPVTDSLVAAISQSSGVTADQVSIRYDCATRRAMSLAISFSITLAASELESTALNSGAANVVSLLDSAVSSGEFAASVSNEAVQRGEIIAVKAKLYDNVCHICDIDEVIVTNIQVSDSVYLGTIVLLLLVAVPLFFGELAILIGFGTGEPSSDNEQSTRKTRESNCAHTQPATNNLTTEESDTRGSDAEFDRSDEDGNMVSGGLSR